MYERYKLPIMITENGLAENDWVCLDGKVHDAQRADFLKRYLYEIKRAADEGIPVIGYHYWSVMDNFEWAEGYGPCFGLIYVDFQSGKRILKDRAYEYKKIIESNEDNLKLNLDIFFPKPQTFGSDKIKVACIGDSITCGAGVSEDRNKTNALPGTCCYLKK